MAHATRATSPQLGPAIPCGEDIGSCVQGVAPAFVGAGGNIRALAACDKQASSARIAPRIQCVGTKPTANQIASQLGR